MFTVFCRLRHEALGRLSGYLGAILACARHLVGCLSTGCAHSEGQLGSVWVFNACVLSHVKTMVGDPACGLLIGVVGTAGHVTQ